MQQKKNKNAAKPPQQRWNDTSLSAGSKGGVFDPTIVPKLLRIKAKESNARDKAKLSLEGVLEEESNQK